MNFLSHDHVLPEQAPSLTRVGAALPDLWPFLPRRPLPMVVLRRLRAGGSEEQTALADGIASHLAADAAFHRHPEFHRRVQLVAPELRSAWPGLRHVELAAHVLVEMLLDRWLIARDPGLVARYYSAFTHANRDAAARMSVPEAGDREPLRHLLDRFVTSGFLAEYRTAPGLLARFAGSLSATPKPPSQPPPRAVTRLVERLSGELARGAAELLGEVRTALLLR
jgi:hypothetical protein